MRQEPFQYFIDTNFGSQKGIIYSESSELAKRHLVALYKKPVHVQKVHSIYKLYLLVHFECGSDRFSPL